MLRNNANRQKHLKFCLNRVEGNICITLVPYESEIKVLIFNAVGEKVWTNRIETLGTIVADLSRCPRGFYFVSAQSGGEEEMTRIFLSNTLKRVCFITAGPLNSDTRSMTAKKSSGGVIISQAKLRT